MNVSDQLDVFRRWDHQQSLELLSAIAAACSQNQLLPPQLSEELRLQVRQWHQGTAHQASFLTFLEHNKSEFLGYVLARYGLLNLESNLFRLLMRNQVLQTIETLQGWCQHLLDKSQLYFNRAFYIYTGQGCERKILYSQLITELAARLGHAATQLEDIVQSCRVMAGHDLPLGTSADLVVDQQAAQTLGFVSVASDAVPFARENQVRRQFGGIILQIVEDFGMFAEQCLVNTNDPELTQLEIKVERLKTDAVRLLSINFPQTGQVDAWETRRQHLWLSLGEINQSLGDLAAFGAPSLTHNTTDEHGLPTAAKRQLILTMMVKGFRYTDSAQAVHALLEYTKHQNVSAESLIPAELKNIHPLLTDEVLNKLISIMKDEQLSHYASHTKEQTMKTHQLLKNRLAALLQTTLVLLCALGVSQLNGCGLKTSPKSEIEDFRPEIKFRKNALENWLPAAPPKREKNP